VATDVLGVSGRAMLAALVAGTSDPTSLADLARGKLRDKLPLLERALTGRVGAHQRFLLGQQLAHLENLDELIERLNAEVSARLRPFMTALARLDTIPGVGRRTAETLVAELGTDLHRFPTAAHLASWAGMCPGNYQSAGKRGRGTTRKGDPWLRTALIEAAQEAGRTRGTYLAAQYHRLARRRGKKKALVAVGHTILVIAYHLLTQQTTYRELPRRSSIGFNRCWKTRTSRLRASPPTSWASRDAPCWRRWSLAPPIRRPWRTWPKASCAASARNWSTP
jgi:transposase